MLGGSEGGLLARLAIFAGPFCLEDVEQVCTDPGLSHSSAPDGIATLISKPLPGMRDLRARHPVRTARGDSPARAIRGRFAPG